MQTGWLKKANKWYYFNGSGIMQTSKWINNKGKWFYFDELGIMQTSKWIKRYILCKRRRKHGH